MRHAPRQRRQVGPRTLKLVRIFGFRYDAARDAYVLPLVGGRIGPVLRTRPPHDSAAAAMEWPEALRERRDTRDRRKTIQFVEHERRSGRDRRQPLAA